MFLAWSGHLSRSVAAHISLIEHQQRSQSYAKRRGRDVSSVWAHVIFWQRSQTWHPDVIALAAGDRVSPILRPSKTRLTLHQSDGSHLGSPVRSRADTQSDTRLSNQRKRTRTRKDREKHPGGFLKRAHIIHLWSGYVYVPIVYFSIKISHPPPIRKLATAPLRKHTWLWSTIPECTRARIQSKKKNQLLVYFKLKLLFFLSFNNKKIYIINYYYYSIQQGCIRLIKGNNIDIYYHFNFAIINNLYIFRLHL